MEPTQTYAWIYALLVRREGDHIDKFIVFLWEQKQPI
jgi:hypothetical protein